MASFALSLMMPLDEFAVKEREIILKETKFWASSHEVFVMEDEWLSGRPGQGDLEQDRAQRKMIMATHSVVAYR
jgi:hypothetical protein